MGKGRSNTTIDVHVTVAGNHFKVTAQRSAWIKAVHEYEKTKVAERNQAALTFFVQALKNALGKIMQSPPLPGQKSNKVIVEQFKIMAGVIYLVLTETSVRAHIALGHPSMTPKELTARMMQLLYEEILPAHGIKPFYFTYEDARNRKAVDSFYQTYVAPGKGTIRDYTKPLWCVSLSSYVNDLPNIKDDDPAMKHIAYKLLRRFDRALINALGAHDLFHPDTAAVAATVNNARDVAAKYFLRILPNDNLIK